MKILVSSLTVLLIFSFLPLGAQVLNPYTDHLLQHLDDVTPNRYWQPLAGTSTLGAIPVRRSTIPPKRRKSLDIVLDIYNTPCPVSNQNLLEANPTDEQELPATCCTFPNTLHVSLDIMVAIIEPIDPQLIGYHGSPQNALPFFRTQQGADVVMLPPGEEVTFRLHTGTLFPLANDFDKYHNSTADVATHLITSGSVSNGQATGFAGYSVDPMANDYFGTHYGLSYQEADRVFNTSCTRGCEVLYLNVGFFPEFIDYQGYRIWYTNLTLELELEATHSWAIQDYEGDWQIYSQLTSYPMTYVAHDLRPTLGPQEYHKMVINTTNACLGIPYPIYEDIPAHKIKIKGKRVESRETSLHLNASPNPTTDQVQLSGSWIGTDDLVLELLTMDGKRQPITQITRSDPSQKRQSFSTKVDLSSLPAGVYSILAQGQDKQYTRIVKY